MDIRTALVTGASSGIGRELALRLAGRGVTVALCARREERLTEIERAIALAGGAARVYPLDVSDTDTTLATLRRADDELGGLDLVVANAGVNRPVHAEALTWDECAPVLRTNIAGAVATLTAVLPRMVVRRRGHIVGISSLAGCRGLPGNATYSASKAFLTTFLEGLRAELHDVGIAVTDVRPGFVATPMTEAARHPQPLKMSVEKAVELVLAGIDRRAAIVEFPWRLAVLANGTRLLPGALFDSLAKRLRGREK